MRSRCGPYQRQTRSSSLGQPAAFRRSTPMVASNCCQCSAVAAGGLNPLRARAPNGGMIVTGTALAAVHRKAIVALAVQYKLPAVYFARFMIRDGGLLSYGPDFTDEYRKA